MTLYCSICVGPIDPPDKHDHCIACLDLARAEAVLDESNIDLPARVLRTRQNMARGLFGVKPTAPSEPLVCPLPHPEVKATNLRNHLNPQSPYQMMFPPPFIHRGLRYLRSSPMWTGQKPTGMCACPCRGDCRRTPVSTINDRLCVDANKARCPGDQPSMGFMVVLQRHLWLNLADLKDADRNMLLNAPITFSGLFGEFIVERFTVSKAHQSYESDHASAHVLATFQI